MTPPDSFFDPHAGPMDPFLDDPNDPSTLLDDLDPVDNAFVVTVLSRVLVGP